MTWVVASFINVIEIIKGKQSEFPVEEVFHLFEVSSREELEAKIEEKINLINRAGEKRIRYYGQDAREVCLGVRKVKSIFNTDPALDLDEDPPGEGAEVGHNYMTVKSLDDAKLLAKGKAVTVHYIDDDPLESK